MHFSALRDCIVIAMYYDLCQCQMALRPSLHASVHRPWAILVYLTFNELQKCYWDGIEENFTFVKVWLAQLLFCSISRPCELVDAPYSTTKVCLRWCHHTPVSIKSHQRREFVDFSRLEVISVKNI
eukprot:180605_1